MISVREAKYEDMPRVASIMVTSFRTAFIRTAPSRSANLTAHWKRSM